MSKASGIFLIASGIGVAAYVMPSHTEVIVERQGQEIAVAEIAATEAAKAPTTARPEAIVVPRPQPAQRPVKVAAATAPKAVQGVGPARPTVVILPERVRGATVSSQPAVRHGPLIAPGDRVGLTRELQRELRRVGCYDGAIDGVWSPASRRAIKAYTDRVNATLPIDQPDYILLRLVQGGPEQACGAACPAGQGLSKDGRCLPTALIVQVSRKAVETPGVTTSGWATTTTVSAQGLPDLPEGRMALAGPKAASVRASDSVASETKAGAGSRVRNNLAGSRPKPATVENRNPRYGSAPRKKFGTWFFKQQDTWNN